MNACGSVATAGVETEFRPIVTLDVFYDEKQWVQAHEALDKMSQTAHLAKHGSAIVAQYNIHSAEQVMDEFSVAGDDPKPLGGLSYMAGSVSSYKLTISMLRACQISGLDIYTKAPVTELVKADGEWQVTTPRGVIKAREVVLATNAYTGYLWKDLHGTVIPIRGQVTAQVSGYSPTKLKPTMSGHSSPTILPSSYSFLYEHGCDYLIQRTYADGREIIMGGGQTKAPKDGHYQHGPTDDTTINPIISIYLRNAPAKLFGYNWGGSHKTTDRVIKEWTGMMAHTLDGYPLVGQVPDQEGLWVCCGFQGHGIALAHKCAEGLVQMMRRKTCFQMGQTPLESDWFPKAFVVTEERIRTKFRTAEVPLSGPHESADDGEITGSSSSKANSTQVL